MFSVKNCLCNCDMDSVFSVKTLEKAVFSVKNAVFPVKLIVFVMTLYKMSLQNAMSDSELIKLVEKITDGGTCTFLRPHGAAPDLPKSCGGEGEEARAAGLRRAYRKHGVRVPFGTVKASGKFRVGVAGYS